MLITHICAQPIVFLAKNIYILKVFDNNICLFINLFKAILSHVDVLMVYNDMFSSDDIDQVKHVTLLSVLCFFFLCVNK